MTYQFNSFSAADVSEIIATSIYRADCSNPENEDSKLLHNAGHLFTSRDASHPRIQSSYTLLSAPKISHCLILTSSSPHLLRPQIWRQHEIPKCLYQLPRHVRSSDLQTLHPISYWALLTFAYATTIKATLKKIQKTYCISTARTNHLTMCCLFTPPHEIHTVWEKCGF